jgi:hypothetical protein
VAFHQQRRLFALGRGEVGTVRTIKQAKSGTVAGGRKFDRLDRRKIIPDAEIRFIENIRRFFQNPMAA